MENTPEVLFKLSVAMVGVSVGLMGLGFTLSRRNMQRTRKKGVLAFILGLLAALMFMANLIILLGLAIFIGDTSVQMIICWAYLLFAAGCGLVSIGLVIAGSGVFKVVLRIETATDGE